jgi:hypothetical protein
MLPSRPALTSVLVVAVVVVLTLTAMRLPVAPASPELDPAWNAVLIHAHAADLVFGRDVVFTYGPLGHLVTYVHTGQPMGVRMAFECAFTLLNVLGIVACAARMPARWAFVILALTALGPTAGMKDVLVPLGMIGWGMACLASGPRFAVVAGLGLGLLVGSAALIKFSWLVVGGLTAAAVCTDLLLRRRWAAAAIVPAGATACGVALWLASGQPAGGFRDYLESALTVAAGYPQTMAFPCRLEKLLVGVATLACIAVAVFASRPVRDEETGLVTTLRRMVVPAWFAAFTFILWKHGFVRADFGHALCFYGTACLVPCALMALPAATPRLATVRRVAAVIALVTLAGMCRKQSVLPLLGAQVRTAASTAGHLIDPTGYQNAVTGSWARARERMAMPRIVAAVGNEPLDVFGASQTYAIANPLNYTPRPVFQSYTAYTESLSRRNADFYRADRAPAWVLFDLRPIDGRLPALEDSKSLALILHSYRYVDEAEPFLLLRRRPAEPLRLEPLEGGSGTVGTPVDLRRHLGEDIWLEIDVRPGMLARIRTLLVRPPQLCIRLATDNPGEPDGDPSPSFTSPLPMVAAGFVASPLCASNADVKRLLHDGAVRRTAGFTLEPGADGRLLAGAAFTYRVSRIAPRLSPPAATAESSNDVGVPDEPDRTR